MRALGALSFGFWADLRELLFKNSMIFATFLGHWSTPSKMGCNSVCKNSAFLKIGCSSVCKNSGLLLLSEICLCTGCGLEGPRSALVRVLDRAARAFAYKLDEFCYLFGPLEPRGSALRKWDAILCVKLGTFAIERDLSLRRLRT